MPQNFRRFVSSSRDASFGLHITRQSVKSVDCSQELSHFRSQN